MRLLGLKGVTAPSNRVLIIMNGLGTPPLMMSSSSLPKLPHF